MDATDCHCFALSVWTHCAETSPQPKPNAVLTKIAGSALNAFLPKMKMATLDAQNVSTVKPSDARGDVAVLTGLGLSLQQIYPKADEAEQEEFHQRVLSHFE